MGWVEAGEVYRLCAERDISVSTIRRARVALGLKTLYIGNQPNRKNYWYQPELEEASVVADITNPEPANTAGLMHRRTTDVQNPFIKLYYYYGLLNS